MATAQEVIKRAASWNGHAEKYNNRTRFNDKFYGRKVNGSAYPWCAAYTSVIMQESGMRPNVDYPHSAGVAVCFNWYRSKGRIISKSKLKPGDQVRYTFSHTGIFVRYNSKGQAVVWEGNTAPSNAGSQRDGGGVHQRTRSLSLIQYGGRPYYSGKSSGGTTPAPSAKGILDMAKRITGSRRKRYDVKGDNTLRHLPVSEDGKNYTIVGGPAVFDVGVKVDIRGLKKGELAYLVLTELLYKSGSSKNGRELDAVAVTQNGVHSVHGAFQLYKDYKGRNPRLRVAVKTKAEGVYTENLTVSGIRD